MICYRVFLKFGLSLPLHFENGKQANFEKVKANPHKALLVKKILLQRFRLNLRYKLAVEATYILSTVSLSSIYQSYQK